MRALAVGLLIVAVSHAALGHTASAGELTGEFLDGTVWDGKYNIEARQSYTAETTLTFKLSATGELSAVVKSKFFRIMRTLAGKCTIADDGTLTVDFTTSAAQRIMRLKLRGNNRLIGDARTLVRGFPGSGNASFTKR